MSQASTGAVAVSAVSVVSQPDPVNESPYPKWSSSATTSVAPSQDGFQGSFTSFLIFSKPDNFAFTQKIDKTTIMFLIFFSVKGVMNSMFDKEGGLNNNRTVGEDELSLY
jgi:hypothetical protein